MTPQEKEKLEYVTLWAKRYFPISLLFSFSFAVAATLAEMDQGTVFILTIIGSVAIVILTKPDQKKKETPSE